MPRRLPEAFLSLAGLALAAGSAMAGIHWQPDGVPVCTATSNQLTPTAVPDGAGGAIVAWYDYRSGNADIYAQHVLSSGQADPAWPADGRALCTASGGQYAAVAVSDGAGGAIVVWYDDRASSSDIYAQRVLASGVVDPAWPPNGRAVCTASGDQIYPAAASDGAGGAVITWRDDRGGPDTDVFVHRVLASGALAPGWDADGVAVCAAGGNQSVPAIVGDGAGGAIVTWSDLRSGTHSDIYAHRVLASGAVDPAWPQDGRALCTSSSNQSGPMLIADGAGGAIVTWYDYRSAVDADIYAHRVLTTGAVDPAWPTNGRAVCTAAGEQYSTFLVGDGTAGAIITWYDYRDGVDADDFAHRVSDTGVPNPAWPTNGRAVCTAAGEQYSTFLVSDGTAGAIITWYDYRDGEESDIYAHRVLAAGIVDPGWPADGRALCTAAGDQVSPTIASDNAGGALITWMDYRTASSSNIYAQRVLAGGTIPPSWPTHGAVLCAASGEQYSPWPVSDGAGGCIVAWTDFRPGVFADIYAERIEAGGPVVDVERGAGAPFELHPIRPNPTRGPIAVRLELPRSGRVTAEVVDAAGRRIRTLVPGRDLEAGAHELEWNGANDAGAAQRGGVYWVRVETPSGIRSRKVALVR